MLHIRSIMRTPRSLSRHARANLPSETDASAFLLGRAYLNYQSVLQSLIEEQKLARYFRPGQGSILFTLLENDGLSMSEIAARTSLAASSVTQVISQMEGTGLVKRQRDPEDGRAVRVHLTPLARRLEPKCRLINTHIHQVLEAGLSKRDVTELRRLLGVIVQNLHGYFTQETHP